MATLTVGSNGQPFSTITAAVAAAQPGDTIQVQAGTYTNDFPAYINGLTIEGIGGQVNLVATQQVPNGKGIFDVGGSTTLRNISFSGATVNDANGAGVRYEGGDLSIQNSVFHDNQDGLLGNVDPNGTITIDRSEFYNNGTGAGNTHNMYIGDIKQFTLTNSYIHDANVGHEIKSRAESNTITGNRIFDNNSTSSYSVDLPDGGNAIISGNTIEQGPNGQNPTIIAYGEEGGNQTITGSPHVGTNVSFTGNTVVNDLTDHYPNLFWDASGVPIDASGNTVYGIPAGQLGVGSGLPSSSGFTYTSARPALDTSSPVSTGSASPTPAPTPPSIPQAAPTSVPTPGPAVTQGGTFGSGDDTLTVTLAEDAYQGDAQANVAIDGRMLTATPLTVTALQGAGAQEVFTFKGNFGSGSHAIAVTFLNDAWGGSDSTDRNLYLDGAALNGNASTAAATPVKMLRSGDGASLSASGGTNPHAAGTPAPTAAPLDTLTLHLSEDAWQGDAQFVASIDGHQLGAAQSVSALHAAGGVQDFTYTGAFGIGPHDLAVTFLNDAWGGTDSTDRNLYVTGADYDGNHLANASATFLNSGTVHFQIPALTGS